MSNAPEPQFHDSEFQSAEEKKKVLKHWQRFIDSGFTLETFTRLLYNHLIQHCSFIAHYDRQQFHTTYFTLPADTLNFLRQFDRDLDCPSVEYGMNYWLNSADYRDINNAMVDAIAPKLSAIRRALQQQDIRLAEQQLQQAQTDLDAKKRALG